MSYGWLEPRLDIVRDRSWFGVDMDPTLCTRWEEFTFARDQLWPGDHVLDAGCGFEPRIHVMPEIAAEMGCTVEAIDSLDPYWKGASEAWARLPAHPSIARNVMDMRATTFPDAHFDVVLSISVLEHSSPEDRRASLTEFARVLKPHGLLVVTMDALWPSPTVPGFTFGAPVVPPEPLFSEDRQPVSFLLGTRQ